jgi:hypothetical protein
MLCSELGRIWKENILKYSSYPFKFMKGLSCYRAKTEIHKLLCVRARVCVCVCVCVEGEESNDFEGLPHKNAFREAGERKCFKNPEP